MASSNQKDVTSGIYIGALVVVILAVAVAFYIWWHKKPTDTSPADTTRFEKINRQTSEQRASSMQEILAKRPQIELMATAAYMKVHGKQEIQAKSRIEGTDLKIDIMASGQKKATYLYKQGKVEEIAR